MTFPARLERNRKRNISIVASAAVAASANRIHRDLVRAALHDELIGVTRVASEADSVFPMREHHRRQAVGSGGPVKDDVSQMLLTYRRRGDERNGTCQK